MAKTVKDIVSSADTSIKPIPKQVMALPVKFNLAEFLAKLETENSIKTLIKLRDSEEEPGAVRRGCANDLLNRGHGTPAATVHFFDETKNNVIMPEEIQQYNSILFEVSQYVGKIPYNEWPDHIKEFMGVVDAEEE